MEHPQNYLILVVGVVAAFFLAGGAALCNGTPVQDDPFMDIENDPQVQAAKAEIEARRRVREGLEDPGAGGNSRVAGAFYPDEQALREPESGGFDPLIVAGVGGGLVFGLVGGAAFLVLGRKEDEPNAETPAEPEP